MCDAFLYLVDVEAYCVAAVMVKLTLDLIKATSEESSPATTITLSLSRKDLHEVTMLNAFEKLERLDLSGNRLQSIQPLSNCKILKWLSISNNELQSLQGIENLLNLTVLNGSRNKITSMDDVSSLVQLRALILNDNQIKSICQLDRLSSLNTLVLSRNPIIGIGKTLRQLSCLVKLSLSNCELQEKFTLGKCSMIKELRLAQNKLNILPKGLKNANQLQILDLGKNHLESFDDIKVLRRLSCLVNLNLRGNPLCSHNHYEAEVMRLIPDLQILDGHPLHGAGARKQLKGSLTQTTSLKSQKSGEVDANIFLERQKQADGTTSKSKKQKQADGTTSRVTRTKVSLKVNEEDKPFFELIGSSQQSVKSSEIEGKVPSNRKGKQLDSGVVKITSDIQNSKERKHGIENSLPLSILSENVSIGEGGLSMWDDSL